MFDPATPAFGFKYKFETTLQALERSALALDWTVWISNMQNYAIVKDSNGRFVGAFFRMTASVPTWGYLSTDRDMAAR